VTFPHELQTYFAADEAFAPAGFLDVLALALATVFRTGFFAADFDDPVFRTGFFATGFAAAFLLVAVFFLTMNQPPLNT